MPTKLEIALKQDFNEYKKEMAVLEKEEKALQKKIETLNGKYQQVLELMDLKTKPTRKSSSRGKRGQTKQLIIDALSDANQPLRANEIIDVIHKDGFAISNAAIRQQLPKLIEQDVIMKDSNKAYRIKVKTIRRTN